MQWPRAFILLLPAARLRGVVGGDDRVVLDAHDGHPVGRRPEVAVAGLAHVPGGLGAGALAARAALGRVDAGIGEQLVEVVEPEDVADLGDERRARSPGRRPGWSAAGGPLAVEEAPRRAGRRPRSGARAGRTGRAGGRPRRRPRRRARAPRSSRPRRPGAAPPSPRRAVGGPGPALASASVAVRRRVAARAVGASRRTSRAVRQVGSSNSSPSSGKPSSTRRYRRWQTLRLLGHEGHREARGLAQLDARPAGRARSAASRMPISARLRASAGSDFVRPSRLLAKYFAASGLTTATGTPRRREVARERHPVVARRFHRHQARPARAGRSSQASSASKPGPALARSGGPPGRPSPRRPGSAPPRGPGPRCRSRRWPSGQPPSADPRGARSLRSTSAAEAERHRLGVRNKPRIR